MPPHDRIHIPYAAIRRVLGRLGGSVYHADAVGDLSGMESRVLLPGKM
ncbi:hypothetical protein [Microbispora siamensis]|uniref:Uncharacterized protein n=1 Tax=Microbispora siamensis TaxID=564413 RepID=A0ABQ4GTH0_9ACTN|nr:hypothetical protein [Microbispora siamensis]GIH64751.1 hypothetical protein Msi02_55680 [Microbispora siamensis]